MAFLRVHKAGLLTTVQDRGRWGYQARGVPVSGAMDLCAHHLANALVGNDDDAATLEVTLTGPDIEFESLMRFAVTGAEFRLTLDGTEVLNDVAVLADAGAHLTFGGRRRGARAYVAVAGGILVPAILGSRATHVVSRMGGVDGRPLRPGDRLEIGTRLGPPGGLGRDRVASMPLPVDGARVRVLLGPHDDRFDEGTIATLISARYRVSTRSDRMGYRLEGPRLPSGGHEDLISDAMPLGGLQVPPSGQPILLMADHATTGGYPIIATVITADLPMAGQLAPGDWIEFAPCSLEQAGAALQRRALHGA